MRPQNISVYRSKSQGAYCLDIPAGLAPDGKRHRRYFPSKKEADDEKSRLTAEIRRHGTDSPLLPLTEQLALKELSEKVARLGGDLRAIVNDWVARQAKSSIAVSELCEDFIDNRAAGFSAPYVTAISNSVSHWKRHYGNVVARSIDGKMARDMLNKMGATPSMWNFHRRHLSVIMSHAVSLGFAEFNPFAQLKPRATPPRTIHILTPDQMVAALAVASKSRNAGWLVPYLALCGFSGCRVEEVYRLNWPAIGEKQIDLPIAGTKTKSRRLVAISPNLAEWLAPYRQPKGCVVPLTPNRWGKAMQEFRAKLPFEWHQNVLRHSFCSYHLASTGNMHDTAMEAGHRTTKMLFQHYLNGVTKDEAAEWWDIRPAAHSSPHT